MPPTSAILSEHSRRRLKVYLSTLMRDRPESKNKIGGLVGVNAHRVTEWLSGNRLISPEKAFDLGNALRVEFGWATSGIEFLWACAYWPEILAILKYMSADDANNGAELAVRLYSWLPMRMFETELGDIELRLREKFGIITPDLRNQIYDYPTMAEFLPHLVDAEAQKRIVAVMESDPGAREIQRYYSDSAQQRYDEDGKRHDTCEHLDDLCQSEGFQERIVHAWERYNNGELEGKRSQDPHLKTLATVARIERYIIDAMIETSRKLNEVLFPSYAVPRVWRMSAGWIYEINPTAARKWFVALPDNFVNLPDVFIRDDQQNRAEAELDALAEEQQQLDEMNEAKRDGASGA